MSLKFDKICIFLILLTISTSVRVNAYYKDLADGAVEKNLSPADSQAVARWSSVPPASFDLLYSMYRGLGFGQIFQRVRGQNLKLASQVGGLSRLR